ncbi:MAG: DNA-binding HxlR family transcriptional regulator [Halocynthiibacter sp.]|jgi:DNA-binding HxlR family transcriptional regulator
MLTKIGDKWTVLVVSTLGAQALCIPAQGDEPAQRAPCNAQAEITPMRFSEIQRAIGNISQKMLTSTLRNLERDGFVIRTVTPSRPPRVDYELTDLGRDLLIPVQQLGQWAVNNAEKIAAARATFDQQNAA